jgi:hypothetical protein
MAPETTYRYLNASRLRDRGWTPAMVRDLLGQPDRLARNRRFPGAARVRLYDLSRVEDAERKTTFKRVAALAARRSAAARAGAQRRRELVLRLMAADQITVPRLEPSVLTARAVRHRDEREGELTDPAEVDRRTLDRWKVNYLRHQLTTYDTLLDDLFGKAGRPEAERMLRRRVYAAIWNTYPDLADECQRQLRARERP